MTSKIIASLLAVLLVGSLAFGGGVSAVAAQEDTSTECSFLEQIADDSNCEGSDGLVSQYMTGVNSVYTFSQAAASDYIAELRGESAGDKNASQIQSSVTETWNNKSSERVTYINDRVNQSQFENESVAYELNIEGANDTTATSYVTFDVDENGNITGTEMVNDTSLEPEESFTVTGDFAQNLNSELESFDSEFMSADETPDSAYLSSLSGQYCGDIDGTHSALEKINDNPASAVFCG